MLLIIILLILALGAYSGARRGLVLQVVHLIGYLVAYLFALTYYQPFSKLIEMWVPYPSYTPGTQFILYNLDQALNLDQSFYKALAFLILMFAGWLLVRMLGYIANELTYLPVLKQFNKLLGALLGLFTHYVTIFFILFILSMLPLDRVQAYFEPGQIVHTIVTKTPVLSHMVMDWISPQE